MIKLFRISDRYEDIVEWCFALNQAEALKIFKKDRSIKGNKKFKVEDVTEKHINDDGFKNLTENGFIGIPEMSIFMLNGCMSSMINHYETKGRSGTKWWSEKIPGSKEL